MPFNWSLSLEDNSKYDFLCGYYKLCNLPEHFEGIVLGNKKDLEIFKKRKKELELWLEKLDYYNKEITFEKGISPKGEHDDLIKHIRGQRGDFASTSSNFDISDGFAEKMGRTT